MILIGIATYIAIGLLASEVVCHLLGQRIPTTQYVILTLLWSIIVPRQLWASRNDDTEGDE